VHNGNILPTFQNIIRIIHDVKWLDAVAEK